MQPSVPLLLNHERSTLLSALGAAGKAAYDLHLPQAHHNFFHSHSTRLCFPPLHVMTSDSTHTANTYHSVKFGTTESSFIMPARGTGIFKGFDLEDVNSLRDLAIWLLKWREGEEQLQYDPIPTSAIQIRRGTIDRITRLMDQSPLIQEIMTSFLETYVNSSRRNHMLAAGQLLSQYAISQAEFPKAHDYHLAVEAWRTRTPIGPPGSVLPDHAINIAKIMKDIRKKEKARAREDWPESAWEDHYEIDAYNRKAVEEIKAIEAQAKAEELAQEKKEAEMARKRRAEDEAMEDERFTTRPRIFSAQRDDTSSISPPYQLVPQARISCRDDSPHLPAPNPTILNTQASVPTPTRPKAQVRIKNPIPKRSEIRSRAPSSSLDTVQSQHQRPKQRRKVVDNGPIMFPGLSNTKKDHNESSTR